MTVPASDLSSVRLARWLARENPAALPAVTSPCADAQRQWTDAMAIGLASGLLPAIFRRHLPDQAAEPPATPADREARRLRSSLAYRHASQTAHLEEAVACLNRVGVIPLLSGHARSLWLDERPDGMGRSLRVLVSPADLSSAAGIFSGLGYRKSRTLAADARRTRAWVRPDSHGWIALTAIDCLLPAGLMSNQARGPATARVLAAGDDAMQELAAEQGRRLISRPVVSLEALYRVACSPEPTPDVLASSIELRRISAAARDAAQQVFGRGDPRPGEFVNADPLASLDAYAVALGRRAGLLRFGLRWHG